MMFGFITMIPESFFAAVKTPLLVTLSVFGVLLLTAIAFTVCELKGGKRQKERKE